MPTSLKCPDCGGRDNRVTDSRFSTGGFADAKEYIWRRRFCKDCGNKFTTIEIIIDPERKKKNGGEKESKAADE